MSKEESQLIPDRREWFPVVSRYQASSAVRSAWQLVNTLVPYFAMMVLMYWSLRGSYWLTLLLAVPAAGLAVRLFIISHDCGHGAFFKTKRLNDFWGQLTALLVWTPYVYWRNEHAQHHASAGNLDRRGVGDIWTLTVEEYQAKPLAVCCLYRLYRNPLVLFVVGPLFLFVVWYRFWDRWAGKSERLSVLVTNLFLALALVLAHVTMGLKALVLIQLPVLAIAASAGVWLFYVQHQFEDGYWDHAADWSFFRMAIDGSSYYQLPRILQWFTCNIGFHHVHHLSPRIPNYRLESCHRENQLFRVANVITVRASLKSLRFRLWDESRRKMIGFGALSCIEGSH